MHSSPALHNAMWPGLVGKGPDSEPPIDLDTMLDLTAAAEVDGVRFDGVDLFLSFPHTSIDSAENDLAAARRQLLRQSSVRGLPGRARLGSPRAAARRWAMKPSAARFLAQVKKACRIGRKLRDLGVRSYGIIRIDSAASPADWAKDPAAGHKAHCANFSRGL